ncbi:hypothetical protein EVU96_13975 [Bacillus infantis]|uniref:hypothetical protein n=1 Tax=Bacillus infantis TaxID=324767 RepID=UPI00101CC225|nr:hypothetical protein [Bacillus infantis]RYI28284.1 hypothetical protein EVU96_13975 [Bacillus infantis]
MNNIHEDKFNLGLKWLHLIAMCNEMNVPKEKVEEILLLWSKETYEDIKKGYETGKISKSQFDEAKERCYMASLEASWGITKIMV